jgi:lysophospholipase L1-like esterase
LLAFFLLSFTCASKYLELINDYHQLTRYVHHALSSVSYLSYKEVANSLNAQFWHMLMLWLKKLEQFLPFWRLSVFIIAAFTMAIPAVRASGGGRAQIVLLGDSITQMSFSSPSGFGAHLANVYQRRADVLNRGFSGYNTNWILELLRTDEGHMDVFGVPPPPSGNDSSAQNNDEATMTNPAVRMTIIFFGANDSSCSKLNARHHVPIDQFKANLKEIAAVAQKACPRTKLLFMATPPIHHAARLKFQIDRYGPEKATGELERTLELSGKYATAACEVAKSLSAPCYNIWADMQSSAPDPEWHGFLSDGLHLSPEGNAFVREGLEKIIREEFSDMSVNPCSVTGMYGNSGSTCSDISHVGPWHDEITDPKEYSHAFKKQKVCETDE